MLEIEVYVVIDSNENVVVGLCRESAIEEYEEEIGSLSDVDGFTITKIRTKVRVPVMVEIEAKAEEVA